MKKLFFSILFFTISINLFGQLSIGFKAGVNASNIVHKGNIPPGFEQDTKTSISFHGGIFSELHLTKKLLLAPEILFSQRGYKYEEQLAPQPEETRINLNYVELPILVTFVPSKIISLQLGPNIGYKISSIASANGNNTKIEGVYDKDFDFGISGGIRSNPIKELVLFARYYYGLLKIDEVYFSQNETVSQHNRNFQVGIGCKLN